MRLFFNNGKIYFIKTFLFFTFILISPSFVEASIISKTINWFSGTDINSGLVGHWTFDGKDMVSNVADKSGNGNTGYLNNMTASNAKVIGKSGQALSFDGVNDYVSTTNVVNIQMTTVSAWIKLKKYPSSKGLIAGFMNGINSGSYDKNLYVGSDGKLYFYTYPGYLVTTSEPVSTLPLNKWIHVLGTANGANIKAYVNGVEVGTAAAGYSYTGYTVPNIFINGSVVSGGGYGGTYAEMEIDDVRVWNRALSTREITQLYNQSR